MPDESTAKPDQPYVAHYDWSAIPGVEDPKRLTPEQQTENDRHAADRASVERGHGLRLALAVPIVIWSFAGVAVLGLAAVVIVIWLVGRGHAIDGFEVTGGLVGFLAIVAVLEIATIRAGTLLIRDNGGPGAWLVVLVSAGAAMVAIGFWLGLLAGGPQGAWVSLAAAVYTFVVGVLQWVRERRLADAVQRLEEYSP
jgi:hypothetical protein